MPIPIVLFRGLGTHPKQARFATQHAEELRQRDEPGVTQKSADWRNPARAGNRQTGAAILHRHGGAKLQNPKHFAAAAEASLAAKNRAR